MIIYRPHRGRLDEAMKEKKEFINIEEMKEYVLKYWNIFIEPLFSLEDIVISESIGDDDRIGWMNVRHVCVKRMGSEKYDYPQCIGWCSFDYIKTKER